MRMFLSISLLLLVLPLTLVHAQSYSRAVGQKHFETANHLGNVVATTSGRKVAEQSGTTGLVDAYEGDVVSYGDYYPYGMLMEGRGGDEEYRFGFQGQEQDDEVKGEGNSINYTYRMHNVRLGRFQNTDPLENEFPYNSTYAFSENVVVNAVELEGAEKDDVNNLGSEKKPVANASNKDKFTVEVNLGRALGSEFNNTVAISQIFGNNELEYYSNNYINLNSTRKPQVVFIDEPNNFVQIDMGKGNLKFSALYLKQKFKAFENGFQHEAASSVEFGLNLDKKVDEIGNFKMSLDYSITAGAQYSKTQFVSGDGVVNTDRKMKLFGQQPVGGSSTFTAGLNLYYKDRVGFSLKNVLHYSYFGSVKTSIGNISSFHNLSYSLVGSINYKIIKE